jgi:ubiquinone/menaquinone biosynthesis C-methylase UbiE
VKEFTGERVIPGLVDNELWDEHIARYAFASRLAAGKRVLDIGCGTGYGVAEMAPAAAFAVGIDAVAAAVPGALVFVQASATALPFKSESFDLITAFEVIEHLTDWQQMLAEARRVLHPDGILLVSTPNKSSYAESRADAGPNPFHVHEFEYAEFHAALQAVFPAVSIYLQNRVEAFAFFHSSSATEALPAKPSEPEHAQFFLAACALRPSPLTGFVYLPTASNLLRERERHIRKLQDELALTKDWLAQLTSERDQLLAKHTELTLHLEQQNRWALGLEKDWKAALDRISQLQNEFHAEQAAAAEMAASYERALADVREDNRQKTHWALDTETRLTETVRMKCEELADAVRLLDRAEATVAERTVWAQSLQTRLDAMERQLHMIRESRWLKLGRAVGLGPQVDTR